MIVYSIMVFFIKVNIAIVYYLYELVCDIHNEDLTQIKHTLNQLCKKCKTYSEVNNEIANYIYSAPNPARRGNYDANGTVSAD